MSHDEELDGLYASPLEDFVSRRNELAKRLRAGGDKAAADRVKTDHVRAELSKRHSPGRRRDEGRTFHDPQATQNSIHEFSDHSPTVQFLNLSIIRAEQVSQHFFRMRPQART